MSTVEAPSTLARPTTLRELFGAFTLIALQGFGGVLAVVQRELVENKRWMTKEEFIEEWAVAQIMPGPNVINLAITLGSRYFGPSGVVVAVAGLITCPLLLLLALALVYTEFSSNPRAAGALRGMGAVAAGLVLSTALKLASTLRTNRMGPWVGAAFSLVTFVAIAWLRVPLVWIVLGLGTVAIAVAWQRLRAP